MEAFVIVGERENTRAIDDHLESLIFARLEFQRALAIERAHRGLIYALTEVQVLILVEDRRGELILNDSHSFSLFHCSDTHQ